MLKCEFGCSNANWEMINFDYSKYWPFAGKYQRSGRYHIYRPMLMWTSIIDSSPFAAIGLRFPNNKKHFSEEFKFEAFQNTFGARNKDERPTAMQNFWWMGFCKTGPKSTFYRKIVFRDKGHVWFNGYVNYFLQIKVIS